MRASRAAAFAALMLAAVTALPAAPTAAAATTGQVGPAGTWYSMSNYRVLDTRAGKNVPVGTVGPDSITRLDITKVLFGITPTAVVMNVTAVDATDNSFITAFPDGQALPTVSNLNATPNHRVTSNRATVQVGADGVVNIYNHVGRVHLVVDLQGYYSDRDGGGDGGRFVVGEPTRLLDTRTTIGGHPGKLVGGAAGVINLDASSVGAPSDNMVVQATVTEPTESAHVTMYPAGQSPWNTSDLNFDPGQTVTNLSYAYTTGDRRLALYANSGEAHVVVDYIGGFSRRADDSGNSGKFIPVSPVRVLDTREGLGAAAAKAAPGSTTRVKVTGLNGVPETVAAVVLNLTGTNASEDGHITAFRAGAARPSTSSLNYTGNEDTGAMTVVPVSTDGYIELYNPHGSVDLVADVQGFYSS
ncbi:hypothetical protein ACIGZJ_18460 [Kitasatospora sp. NPDC052868]|uniref:hypothetical protein n=1 Tax=Kitasatospora sp. NPDC052868 TaxID=3364060 RepID=UPI0037C8AA21